MAQEKETRSIHQPLHSSLLTRLDPQYIAFHNTHLQYIPPSETQPFDRSNPGPGPATYGSRPSVAVHKILDFAYGTHEEQKVRVFIPEPGANEGKKRKKLPSLIWFHGGGWVMGGLNSENGFLTRVCRDVGCVVVSVNYRHAPENVYPAAVEDIVAGYRWVLSEEGKEAIGGLGVDVGGGNVAVGGLSSGGGLAAILSLKAAELSLPPPIFQLLLLPVIDNTATDSPSSPWTPNSHAPWLTPSRMLWYRAFYLPNKADWKRCDASPNLAPSLLLRKCPKTWIAAADCDILFAEAQAFGKLLKENAVDVEFRAYEGGSHSLLILDGVLEKSRELVEDAIGALKGAFCTI